MRGQGHHRECLLISSPQSIDHSHRAWTGYNGHDMSSVPFFVCGRAWTYIRRCTNRLTQPSQRYVGTHTHKFCAVCIRPEKEETLEADLSTIEKGRSAAIC